jgi:DUF1680 family protein
MEQNKRDRRIHKNMKTDKMGKRSKVIRYKELEYDSVRITDAFLENAFRLELKYLNELDVDKLLCGFLETGGAAARTGRYPGWESTEIQGHTLGHYMTAISQAYGETKDEVFLRKIEYTLSELRRSQHEDGYLFASPSELFDRVENKRPVWVPWYTMHKVMEGLIAAYRFTGSETAYEIMTSLGLWIYRRCCGWSEETRAVVLDVEYGGMNDCLYDLYMETGDERFAQAAHQFDEMPLFQAMYENRDILNGLHANATIPKLIGGLKRYIAFGNGEAEDEERFYLQAAENFYRTVTEHHTYITGGNSEWEHFGEPDVLDDERTACNCETCNTYNMLKLSKLLFQITGEKKYADYYERSFINTILSSQHPKTGMTTYFQPMATGYFKVFGTPFDRFWCCTGTGMENFTKLTEGIYFTLPGRVYINRFVNSKASTEENGLELEVTGDFLVSDTVRIKVVKCCEKNEQTEIALRIPEWCEESPQIKQTTKETVSKEEEGYLILSSRWQKGDEIEIAFPMGLALHSLPDNKNAVAFTYGPFVLSAGLGRQMMDMTITGVDVLVPMKELLIKDYIVVEDGTISEWKADLNKNLVRVPGKLEFILKNTEADRELIFTPHYARYQDRYGIYFKLCQKGSQTLARYREREKRRQALSKSQIDTVPIGNEQYELAHHIKGEKTDTSRVDGHRCRYVKENGWFSYELGLTEKARKLCVTYADEDEGSSFHIYLNDELFAAETLFGEDEEFYTKEYLLPEEMLRGNNTVTVKFQNIGLNGECRIFDELYIKK